MLSVSFKHYVCYWLRDYKKVAIKRFLLYLFITATCSQQVWARTFAVYKLSQVSNLLRLDSLPTTIYDYTGNTLGKPVDVNQVYQTTSLCTYFFYLSNDFAQDTTFYFKGAENGWITLIISDAKGHELSRQITGFRQPIHQQFGEDGEYFLPVSIAAGATVKAQVIIKGFLGVGARSRSYLYTPVTYFQHYKASDRENNTQDFIVIFFTGATLMLLLFFWFMYIESRQVLYGRYALYLTLQWLYGVLKLGPLTLIGYELMRMPVLKFTLIEPVVLAAVGSYTWFVNELLALRTANPMLYKVLKGLAYFLWIYSCAFLIIMLIHPDASFRVPAFRLMRLFLLSINLILLIYIAYKVKSSVKSYYLIGNFLFLLFSIIAGFSNYVPVLSNGYLSKMNITTWYMTGILLECIFFAFALGIRIKELQQLKQEADQKLITQMQVNERLANEAKLELERKVAERTAQIKEQAKQLEEVRLQETRAAYEKQLSEIRMQALRSRMNPHFIFNSLNSIKYFILKNENDTAEFYLNKFSRLLRLILDYTTHETISLQQELEALNVYLEIESVRFDKSFHYHIHVDETVDTEKIRIPPLLLQPFVENAIWHGLANSDKDEKYCFVEVIRQNSQVLIQIIDNGVGRAESARINENKPSRHNSYGLKITEDRIALFNNTNNGNIEIAVEDNMEDAEPAGTTVNITFKNPLL